MSIGKIGLPTVGRRDISHKPSNGGTSWAMTASVRSKEREQFKLKNGRWLIVGEVQGALRVYSMCRKSERTFSQWVLAQKRNDVSNPTFPVGF